MSLELVEATFEVVVGEVPLQVKQPPGKLTSEANQQCTKDSLPLLIDVGHNTSPCSPRLLEYTNVSECKPVCDLAVAQHNA
ncbi:MAG TPA: hypothetical protein VG408_07430 [Actinomycetota bacterium]|nr:hypothetical protein [Actinomycetota bacterium]